MAKKDIRNKLNRLVEIGVLDNWKETPSQIWVTPSSQIIKNKESKGKSQVLSN